MGKGKTFGLKKWSDMTGKEKKSVQYLALAVPFVAFIFAFSYVPLFGWAYAFFDYRAGKNIWECTFVGFSNFAKLFGDRDVIRVLRNTLVMSFLNLLTSPLPMLFAIMLNDVANNKLKKVVQTITTLPHFISWITVFGLAFTLFSSQGMATKLMDALNIPHAIAGLLGDGDNVWLFQLALGTWKGLGWSTIIYMAAITGIDMELYDAAKVDGANKIQLARHITLPGLIPTYMVLLLLSVSNLLNSGFEQYYVFWNSMVSDKIEVLDYYIYKLGFMSSQYSYSIAVGMLKSIVSIILLFTANRISKKLRGSSLV